MGTADGETMGRSLISGLIVLIIVGCAQKREPFSLKPASNDTESVGTGGGETGGDTDSQPVSTDSAPIFDSDSNVPTETDLPADTGVDDSETESISDEEILPGDIGDPCWIPPFSAGHPNAGLQDCREELHCIGDSDEAWCTVECAETGTVSASAEIAGWCCGEVGSACAPTRYYMPATMALNCVPRVLELGDPCQTSGDARCAPLCMGTETIENTVCVQVQGGGFCSFDCTEDADCVDSPAFSTGCCGTAMGNSYCMVETSDRCLSLP